MEHICDTDILNLIRFTGYGNPNGFTVFSFGTGSGIGHPTQYTNAYAEGVRGRISLGDGNGRGFRFPCVLAGRTHA